MANKFTHMSSHAVQLTELGVISGVTVYALASSIESGSITLSGGTINSIATVSEILNVSSLDTIDSITNIISLDTVDKILSINTITEISNVSSLNTVDSISNIVSLDTIDKILSINTLTEITNISSLDTVDSITNIQTLQAGTVTVVQSTHDNLNCNANLQVANSDITLTNPVPINVKSIIDSSMGVNGGEYITSTATTTPSTGYTFFAIQAISNTVISSVTGNIDVSSMALDAGLTIYGAWTAVKLTSGSVVAYQRVT